jgi:hypothetical protein
MKFIIRLLLIGSCAYFLPFYFPWWSIVLASTAIGFFIAGNGFNVFNAGFLGAGLVWLYMAFTIDSGTNSIMSEKIIQLMPFSDTTLLIILTGLIGALVAGLGAVTGNSLKQVFKKSKNSGSLYS